MIYFDEDGYEVNVAPQCLTDILLQVRIDPTKVSEHAHPESCGSVYAFQLGEVMRAQLEDCCGLDGLFIGTPDDVGRMNRMAVLFDVMAITIRAAISVARSPENDVK